MNYEQIDLNLDDDDSSDSKPEGEAQTESKQVPQKFTMASKDDGLGFDSAWEDLHGRNLKKKDNNQSAGISQEDIESSNRVAEHEAEIYLAEKKAEEESKRPASQEELDKFFKKIKEDLS